MATDEMPSRFAVATPQPLLDQLRRWAGQAATTGKLTEFLAVLKDVNHRLETDPHGWGDLLREYVAIDAVQRRGLVPTWFLLWYGVQDVARQVVVQSLLPAPGSPLTDMPASG